MPNALREYRGKIGCSVHELAQEVRSAVSPVAPHARISYREKDPGTLEKKMKRKHRESVFEVTDVYGIRVIVLSVAETYTVLQLISRVFLGSLKQDYIADPKTRPQDPRMKGKKVRFLQYIARKNNVPFEIQITTAEFHHENEPLHEGYHRRKYGC